MSDEIIPAQKSWFSRPEGKVGTFLPILAMTAGGGALIYTWGSVLPWVIRMLQNTLTAMALCAGVAVGVVVISDKRWRNLLFYAYKSLMRVITGWFIEIDPIGILKSYVDSLKKKLEEMDQSITNLAGQIMKLKNQIDHNEAERVHSLEIAREARKRGEAASNVFVLQSRQAGRLEKSNMTLQNLYDRMVGLMKVLKKMREASNFLIQDIQGEVDVKSKERQALLAGYGAFTRAKKIMQGGDERAMFDMTMEKLTDDYGMKMGEIEQFMDMSKAVIQGVDLENGIYEEKALAQLDAWEKKSQNLLLISHEEASPPSALSPAAEPQSNFADLFTHNDGAGKAGSRS